MKVTVTGTRGIPGVMGGVETHCEQLCPRLAERGIDITVARRSSYVDDGLREWRGVHLLDIKTPRVKAFEAIVHTYRAIKAASKGGADIVHINAIGPALLAGYAKRKGLKVVFTHHGPDYDRDKWGFAAKAMLRLGERIGCRRADKVIVISQVIKDLVESKYGIGSKTVLIPNGVPAAEPAHLPEWFSSLGIEPGKYILTLSRFVPEKRLEDVVEAYSSLKASGGVPADFKLVLAGDADFADSYSSELKRRAIEAGAVLPGAVRGDKLHALLTDAALFVLPSTHEGLPISLLEAMSYGLRTVVSDIPANLEVGLPAANYFHVKDTAELASHIHSALASPAPAYDLSRYNWNTIADQVAAIYRSLLPK